jgi:hypothetical protein
MPAARDDELGLDDVSDEPYDPTATLDDVNDKLHELNESVRTIGWLLLGGFGTVIWLLWNRP